ncbi:MAG: hypothetical protein WBK97_08400 [Bacteroidales bacterium]|jgi:hypothetical protein
MVVSKQVEASARKFRLSRIVARRQGLRGIPVIEMKRCGVVMVAAGRAVAAKENIGSRKGRGPAGRRGGFSVPLQPALQQTSGSLGKTPEASVF